MKRVYLLGLVILLMFMGNQTGNCQTKEKLLGCCKYILEVNGETYISSTLSNPEINIPAGASYKLTIDPEYINNSASLYAYDPDITRQIYKEYKDKYPKPHYDSDLLEAFVITEKEIDENCYINIRYNFCEFLYEADLFINFVNENKPVMEEVEEKATGLFLELRVNGDYKGSGNIINNPERLIVLYKDWYEDFILELTMADQGCVIVNDEVYYDVIFLSDTQLERDIVNEIEIQELFARKCFITRFQVIFVDDVEEYKMNNKN